MKTFIGPFSKDEDLILPFLKTKEYLTINIH